MKDLKQRPGEKLESREPGERPGPDLRPAPVIGNAWTREIADDGEATPVGDGTDLLAALDRPALGEAASAGELFTDKTAFGAPSRFPTGSIVAGRYRIVHLLGRGGMGEVYRAEDLVLDQPVALKFLPSVSKAALRQLPSLLEEVKIARQVAHPNVCRVYDIGEVNGEYFISMEFIEGENLGALLRRIGHLGVQQAVDIASQVCRGLAAIHQQGILHHDLKPSNLMIDHRGRARITDFGLALLAEHATVKQIRSGTPTYMAPEQHAGRAVTVRSDLYALGLVLYKMLTGRLPFRASTRRELARHHLESPPPPLSTWLKDSDPKVEEAVLRCLAKDPLQRPASAAEVESMLAGRGVSSSSTALKTLVLVLAGDETVPVPVQRTLIESLDGHPVPGMPLVVLFDRPVSAVQFALALQRSAGRAEAETPKRPRPGPASQRFRIAIQLTEAAAVEEGESGVDWQLSDASRQAALCLARLAEAGQILLSRAPFDLARQNPIDDSDRIRWLAHGSYEVEGWTESLEVYEVGERGLAPLAPPQSSSHGRRQQVQEMIGGWRPAPDQSLPQRRGWRLVRRLGEGGFGEVWLAEHHKTRSQRVFKFCYDPESLRALQREITLFRLLKEALGSRDDINRILDWNFDQAPYFIESEYTPGGSLIEWADARDGLDEVPLATRLDIVAQVATALAAAHSVGVLHKDVKPGNVLIIDAVDGGVRARLSDFGVGWVTEERRLDEAGITILGLSEPFSDPASEWRGGTRLYLAPELLEGKPASLQADIYALGVLLYQVVVGDLKRALAPGWERQIDDQLLREDIAIAVDGSPEQRLSSAAELATRLRSLDQRRADLERARQQREEAAEARLALSRGRRRRRLLLALLTVVSFFAATVAVQSRRVEREAEATRQMSEFLIELFEVADPDAELGNKITARQILDWGAEKIETDLEDQPDIQARLMQTMGEVYGRLGLFDAAQELIERALDHSRQLHGEEDLQVASSRTALAVVLWRRGELAAAEKQARQALALRQKLLGNRHPDVAEGLEILGEILHYAAIDRQTETYFERALEIRRAHQEEPLELAQSLGKYASFLHSLSEFDRAESSYLEALSLQQAHLPASHPAILKTKNHFASLVQTRGDQERAARLYREVLEARRQALGDEHPDVAASLGYLAGVLHQQGRDGEAEALLRQELELRQHLFGERHPSIVRVEVQLAKVLQARGRYGEAEALFRHALSSHQRLYGPEHPAVARLLNALGLLLHTRGRLGEAEDLHRRALEMNQKLLGDSHLHVASNLNFLGYLLQARGDLASARDMLERSQEIYLHHLAPDHRLVSMAEINLARIYLGEGESVRAETVIRRVIVHLSRTFDTRHWRIQNARSVLAATLLAQQKFQPAEEILLEVYPALRQTTGERSLYTRDALAHLIELYARWGRTDEAEAYRRVLQEVETDLL